VGLGGKTGQRYGKMYPTLKSMDTQMTEGDAVFQDKFNSYCGDSSARWWTRPRKRLPAKHQGSCQRKVTTCRRQAIDGLDREYFSDKGPAAAKSNEAEVQKSSRQRSESWRSKAIFLSKKGLKAMSRDRTQGAGSTLGRTDLSLTSSLASLLKH